MAKKPTTGSKISAGIKGSAYSIPTKEIREARQYNDPKSLNKFLVKLPPKGSVDRARYDYIVARYAGGAAKEAAKIRKPEKVSVGPKVKYLNGNVSRANKYEYQVDPRLPSAKELEKEIIKEKQDALKNALKAERAAKLKKK